MYLDLLAFKSEREIRHCLEAYERKIWFCILLARKTTLKAGRSNTNRKQVMLVLVAVVVESLDTVYGYIVTI